MVGGDPAEAPPVVAVGGEAHGAVEEEEVGGFLDRAVGEGGAAEDLLGGVGVAGDDEAREADGEGHEVLGFEGFGEGGEGAVGEGVGEGEGQPEEGEARRPGDRRSGGPELGPVEGPCEAPRG